MTSDTWGRRRRAARREGAWPNRGKPERLGGRNEQATQKPVPGSPERQTGSPDEGRERTQAGETAGVGAGNPRASRRARKRAVAAAASPAWIRRSSWVGSVPFARTSSALQSRSWWRLGRAH